MRFIAGRFIAVTATTANHTIAIMAIAITAIGTMAIGSTAIATTAAAITERRTTANSGNTIARASVASPRAAHAALHKVLRTGTRRSFVPVSYGSCLARIWPVFSGRIGLTGD